MPRRPLPELSEEQAALVELLCSDGRGRLARRPQLVTVADWSTLTDTERATLWAARKASREHAAAAAVTRQAAARRLEQARRAEQTQRRAVERSRQKIRDERRSWLSGHVQAYRASEPWERPAWWAAHRRYRWLGGVVAWVSWSIAASVFLVDQNARLAVLLLAATFAFAGLHLRRALVRQHARALLRRWKVSREEGRRVPSSVRAAVLLRDDGRCCYCGATQTLHLDHRVPFSRGGRTTVENLQLLCARCNILKGVRSDAEARQLVNALLREQAVSQEP